MSFQDTYFYFKSLGVDLKPGTYGFMNKCPEEFVSHFDIPDIYTVIYTDYYSDSAGRCRWCICKDEHNFYHLYKIEESFCNGNSGKILSNHKMAFTLNKLLDPFVNNHHGFKLTIYWDVLNRRNKSSENSYSSHDRFSEKLMAELKIE